jgi:hypothetical protein
MSINIPVSKSHVLLPDDPGDSARQAAAALAAWHAGNIDRATCRAQLNALAARYPTSLCTWAALGTLVLPDDVIAAYAFFRAGYHRGLDRARGTGWNGSQYLSWEHAGNHGFLQCLHGLMRAATAIGETSEVARTRDFLLDLDPTNHFEIRRA